MTTELTISADELEGTTASLSHWLVAIGDSVTEGQPVLELETDKVSMEVCAHQSGVINDFKVSEGDEVTAGMVLAHIDANQASTSVTDEQSMPATVVAESDSESTDKARERLSPAVRRLVQENQLDVAEITGTGRDGRVTREDVEKHLKDIQTLTPAVTKTLPENNDIAQSQPLSVDASSTKVPHTRIRKAIADHMVTSLQTSPHVTSVFEMDMSNIIAHRKWHKKACERVGSNLTYTAYFAYAAALAAKDVPQVNSRYHDDHLEIFNQVHMGIGTALGDQGLVVPVIKNVESLSLYQIAAALTQQTENARAGNLKQEDLKGSTLTISNHGVSGSLFATPIIINQPEVAILGIGKLQKRPVVVELNGEDELVIKPMCYVSLSIDHRALDAHQTNLFLSRFVDIIENWEG